MPDLANQLLFEFRQSSSVRLTASAVQLLVEQTWPGNITEVEPRSKACARRSSGDIIIAADFSFARLMDQSTLISHQMGGEISCGCSATRKVMTWVNAAAEGERGMDGLAQLKRYWPRAIC